jgi:signal peptidase I
VTTVDDHDADRTAPNVVTKARSRRPADYRLRGLDLDARALVEAPRAPVRRRRQNRRRVRRVLVQWTVVLALAATVAMLARAYVAQPFSVRATSMVPTLQAGTEVLVLKPGALSRPTRAGDILVVRRPDGAQCPATSGRSHNVVARVIGLPGETIWSAAGTIYINGQPLNEPGWYNAPFGEVGPTPILRTTIPAGSYFVMGDNRTDTCDSRSFGPVAKSLVVGRVVATVARHGHPFVHLI